MKIMVINISNKRRSKKTKEELKNFTLEMAKKFKIDKKIKLIRLRYTKDFHGYYTKNNRLAGFKKLFNDGIVTIDMTRHWDIDKQANREAVVHELTHVKQILEGRLVVNQTDQSIEFNGKLNETWKKFRFKEYEKIEEINANKYFHKHFPWEKEVTKNIKRYVNRGLK